MICESFPVGPLRCNCSIIGDEATREALVVDPGDNIPDILLRLAKTWFDSAPNHCHARPHRPCGRSRGAAQSHWSSRLFKPVGSAAARDDGGAGRLAGVATPEVAPLTPARKMASPWVCLRCRLSTAYPGHTPGSICLLFKEQQLLLAGDTLFAGSIGRTDLPGGDGRRILRSLHDRLLVLPDTTRVIPGHGAGTTIGAERQSNPFLQPGFRM